MKYKKARAASREGLDADSIITRALATQLIADEIARPRERPERVRNRVSHRIGEAIRRGTLAEQSPGKFRFGELVAWAADTSPKGKFSGWPASRTISPGTGRVVADTYRLTLGMVASADGPDAAQVQRENEKLRAELETVRAERDGLRRENETLRPYKDADERRRAKNRDSARRPRGGRNREI